MRKRNYILFALFLLLCSNSASAQTILKLENGSTLTLSKEFTVKKVEDGYVALNPLRNIRVIFLLIEASFNLSLQDKNNCLQNIVVSFPECFKEYKLIAQERFQGEEEIYCTKGVYFEDIWKKRSYMEEYTIFTPGSVYSINISCPYGDYANNSKLFENIVKTFQANRAGKLPQPKHSSKAIIQSIFKEE